MARPRTGIIEVSVTSKYGMWWQVTTGYACSSIFLPTIKTVLAIRTIILTSQALVKYLIIAGFTPPTTTIFYVIFSVSRGLGTRLTHTRIIPTTTCTKQACLTLNTGFTGCRFVLVLSESIMAVVVMAIKSTQANPVAFIF